MHRDIRDGNWLSNGYPNILNQVLDLSSNSLVTIEGLKDINLLTWLNLANNNIKAMENLNQVQAAQTEVET